MKIVKNFSKIIFLIVINTIFSIALIAVETEGSTGQVIRKLDSNGQLVIAESNSSTNKQQNRINIHARKEKSSDKYLSPENLKLQKIEEEERNKALREQNEIGTLYSDKYRVQNNNDASQFEEEILKSQMNDTGVFLNNNNNLNFSKKDERIRVQAIQEGVLADYKDDIDKKNKKILGFKNPIFFVSEGTDSFSYTNTMDLCSLVNLGHTNIDCLVYPEADRSNISFILRRGENSDFYEKTAVNADFIIVRDDVYSQYKKGRGSIALAPDLDVLMYLNGDYLFMFANSMFNTFSFEHISAQKQGKQIKIGFINQQSRVIFERTLAKLFPNHLYRYQFVNVSTIDRARASICNPTDVDVYIYFGGKLPNNLETAMEDCSSIINPLTLSDSTLSEVIKLTDFFSVANTVGYYPTPSVLNYLEIYIALENSYRKSLKNGNVVAENKINLADYYDNEKTQTTETIKPKAPTMTAREKELEVKRKRAEMLTRQRAEERTKKINELKAKREEKKLKQQELLNKKLNRNKTKEDDDNGKSKIATFFSFLNFDSNSNPVEKKKEESVYLNQELIIKEDTLNKIKGKSNNNNLLGKNIYATEVEQQNQGELSVGKVYITANTAIKTFGIRYVLLASRYAKRENVITVFDSILKDFFLLRESILTPDISKFNISDIILGTSGASKINNYHPALSKYPNYLLELKVRKTPEQTLALKLLNVNSTNVNYPSYYGPPKLTSEQMDTLYTKARELNKRKDELAAIRIYQRDTINIDKALDDMRNGKQPSDSLLKSTGLDYVNAIVDEQSVLRQGLAREERLSPEAMRELEKLINPKSLPVEQVSAEDVKNAVEATEGNNLPPSNK